MLKRIVLLVCLLCVLPILSLQSQDQVNSRINQAFLDEFRLRPPVNLEVHDTPNDNGGSLTITWQLSPDDNLWGKRGLVEKYIIERHTVGEDGFVFINSATSQSRMIFDNSVNNRDEYEYRISTYPFKYIFKPVPWHDIVMTDQVERLKLLSPWITINPQAVVMSLLSGNYDYYARLEGYKSDLAVKSIWENISPDSKLSGPSGIAPALVAGQLISPLGPYLAFMANSARTSDPFQLIALGENLGDGLMANSEIAGPVQARKAWLNTSRVNILVLAAILCFFILFYINQAKSGKTLFIRKIAGLDAVEEAVGRATEMGKEIFFVPGTQDMENIQTIAGVTILGRVARLTAELGTKLEVPVSRSLVMVTAREIVKESYMNAGRPEAFHEDMVHYLTDDQFGYAAAIDGKMVRQHPATIFYMGAFYAESLILAETGNSIGAIQIAGTAMPAQLPFFVAACDYTLIGEELFAASAYLSREPKLLGSLKGQDIGKALLLLALAVGVVVQTFGWFDFAQLFSL